MLFEWEGKGIRWEKTKLYRKRTVPTSVSKWSCGARRTQKKRQIFISAAQQPPHTPLPLVHSLSSLSAPQCWAESLKKRLSTAVFVRGREGVSAWGLPCPGLPLLPARPFSSAAHSRDPRTEPEANLSLTHSPRQSDSSQRFVESRSRGPNEVKWMPVRPRLLWSPSPWKMK